MGKGKGSSQQQPTQPTQQTITQTNIPDWLRGPVERLAGRAESIASEPYQPYPDQRLSVFNPDQNAGFQSVRDIFNAGDPWGVNAAQNTLYGTASRIPAHLADNWNTQAASSYMSPYMDYVMNNVASRERQGFDIAQRQRNDAAIRAGAFGGDRRFVADEIARDSMERRLREIEGTGLNQAYTSALGAFQNDANRRLQVENLANATASGMAGIGNIQQAGALTRANALATVGAGERGLQQQGLDIAYTDFTNQRDYPRQSAAWLSGILRGVPYNSSSEVTQYVTPPNPLNSAVGLGIAGLGAAQAAGLFNSSTPSSGAAYQITGTA